MTTHLGKMSAMSPPEAERMNAEQAIIVARVLTDIESLVASVAKRIAVSQNHSDFTSGMGGYVLVDLDASAVAAQLTLPFPLFPALTLHIPSLA